MSVLHRAASMGKVSLCILMCISSLGLAANAQQTRPKPYPRPEELPLEQRLDMLITLKDVVTLTDRVLGREANVIAYVTNIYNPRLFVVRGKESIINSRVPVITKEPLVPLYGRPPSAPLRIGDEVQIIGKITRFSKANAEKVTGTSIADNIARRFAGKPALVTDFVVVSPPDRVVDAQPGLEATTTDQDVETTPGTIVMETQDQPSLIGRTVRLENVRVTDVISDRGFWIETGTDRRLFALLRNSLDRGKMEQRVQIKAGQTLSLRGVVLPMPGKEAMRSRWTVDAEEADALAKEPVYVYVSAIYFQSTEEKGGE